MESMVTAVFHKQTASDEDYVFKTWRHYTYVIFLAMVINRQRILLDCVMPGG